MTVRNKGIIAYGTQEDRDKLAVLASFAHKSNSEMLVHMIRETYQSLVGEIDPRTLLNRI